MSRDVECPECGADNEINHDDGFGYSEDQTHVMHCSHCDKQFGFHTSIHLHYSEVKTPCLNGGDDHILGTNFFHDGTQEYCEVCDYKGEIIPRDH